MGVIIFTANPLTPPPKLKLEINVLIFGQILNILGLIWATRGDARGAICSGRVPKAQCAWEEGCLGCSVLAHNRV